MSATGAAGVGFVLRRQLSRGRERLVAAVSARLGLGPAERGATGRVEGVSVHVDHAGVVSAWFQHALDFDLSLVSRERSSAGLPAVVQGRVEIRALDPEVDDVFEIDCPDLSRLTRLLTRELRQTLIALSRQGRVQVSDRFVMVTADGEVAEAWLDETASLVVRAAQIVDLARRDVPPRRENEALVAAFEHASARLGLAFWRTPFVLEGAAMGLEIRVLPAELHWGRLGASVSVRFPHPLDAVLFDDPLETVRRAVDQLGSGGAVVDLTDEAVVVRGIADVDALADTIPDVVRLAQELWDRADGANVSSPYR